MATKFINIHNPTTGGRASVSIASFERVWKEKGWVRDGERQVASVKTKSKIENAEADESNLSNETQKEAE